MAAAAPANAQPHPATVIPVTAVQPVPTSQPQEAIASVQIATQLPALPDVGLTTDTVIPQALSVEVAGVTVEVPLALPNAGDGTTAEDAVDDVQP